MKPHKHCEVIKAWADGAEIQWKEEPTRPWKNISDGQPCWDSSVEYRVKPELKTPEEVYINVGFPDRAAEPTSYRLTRIKIGLAAVIEAYKKGELKL